VRALDEAQFLVTIVPGARDECWPWIGPPDGDGYGRAGDERAHRVAWSIFRGSEGSAAGLNVCHHCDNRHYESCPHLAIDLIRRIRELERERARIAQTVDSTRRAAHREALESAAKMLEENAMLLPFSNWASGPGMAHRAAELVRSHVVEEKQP